MKNWALTKRNAEGIPLCIQTLSFGRIHSFPCQHLSSHLVRCHPSCHLGGKPESLPRHDACGSPLGESFVLTLKPTLPPLLCRQTLSPESGSALGANHPQLILKIQMDDESVLLEWSQTQCKPVELGLLGINSKQGNSVCVKVDPFTLIRFRRCVLCYEIWTKHLQPVAQISCKKNPNRSSLVSLQSGVTSSPTAASQCGNSVLIKACMKRFSVSQSLGFSKLTLDYHSKARGQMMIDKITFCLMGQYNKWIRI